MNIFKSPILWGILGIVLIIVGNIYSDKEKYPAMPLISRIMVIGGAIVVGFSGASILKWNPLSKVNLG